MIIMVIGASLLFLAFGFFYVVRVATMGDQMDRLQAAADSSALAGAKAIVDQAVPTIEADLNGHLLTSGAVDSPKESAAQFAAKNDAHLTNLSMNGNRVSVTVQSTQKFESGQYERATAAATTGKTLGTCNLLTVSQKLQERVDERAQQLEQAKHDAENNAGDDSEFLDQPPVDAAKNNDELTVESEIMCGEVSVNVRLHDDGSIDLLSTPSEIAKQFDVHLTK
ncbi:hypothetical protein J2S49_000951 [Arcanobacterium wilhelmae]|uniref:Flp pilus-assembly TadG-like N-terminal domain-containing protein n=1 Tax=Arcanobacterium wilhelmae TaxID=1803177 RepID=A0ABT9NB08_9ACTO|nr:hypothetical protein [Arcanobacterium wilhelmae]MDP9800875.1 hypothetical protein [Arcanobacterium wilhelmae]WFN90242.1 hypothetical protein P8A24_08675 [Arcanobacterium wilhelmae]